MTRGRKPLPTALHLLRGNPGKRPRREPPAPAPIPYLAPPPWLSERAQVEWRRLAPLLGRVGVLTATDGDALATYCEAFVTWQEATQEVRTNGLMVKRKGGLGISPYVKVANYAAAQMRAFLVEFGMTPSARARVHITQPGAKPASKWGGLL